jgi:hypothetical protein
VNETAIDLGRYGHLSTFKENEHFTLNVNAAPKN